VISSHVVAKAIAAHAASPTTLIEAIAGSVDSLAQRNACPFDDLEAPRAIDERHQLEGWCRHAPRRQQGMRQEARPQGRSPLSSESATRP